MDKNDARLEVTVLKMLVPSAQFIKHRARSDLKGTGSTAPGFLDFWH
jgi:hypothetical protein